MDKILINKLEVFGVHGLMPVEKLSPQKFLVSCECCFDSQKAGKTDNVDYTENYHKVTDIITNTLTGTSYNLLETMAEDCALKVLTACPLLTGIKLRLEKPWIHSAKNVESFGIEIERKWHSIYVGLKADEINGQETINNALPMFNSEDTLVEKVSSVVTSENSSELVCAIKLKSLLNLDEFNIVRIGIENSFGQNEDAQKPESPEDENEIIDGEIIDSDEDNTGEYIKTEILLYDDLITSDEFINVPSPEIFEDPAYIKTISEISPYAVEPLSKKRFIDLSEI
ncbi:MAG: dihydroneopterin aldolase [Firmicutes bacterium]|nr:dihydroneopterin aldolase [Bacillota bacterium]